MFSRNFWQLLILHTVLPLYLSQRRWLSFRKLLENCTMQFSIRRQDWSTQNKTTITFSQQWKGHQDTLAIGIGETIVKFWIRMKIAQKFVLVTQSLISWKNKAICTQWVIQSDGTDLFQHYLDPFLIPKLILTWFYSSPSNRLLGPIRGN